MFLVMLLALITAFGRSYRLRLVLEEVRPSLPPPTFDTTATTVEETVPVGPGIAKAKPALRVVRSTEAA